MAHQEALTVIVDVEPARADELQALLETMRSDPGGNPLLPFASIGTIHFGRLVFVPAMVDLDGRTLEAKLALIVDCDGSARACLRSLVEAAGSGIDRLYGHCVGFELPAGSSTGTVDDTKRRLEFLERHRLDIKANYVHRPGRTVTQIRQEAVLYDALERYVSKQDFNALSALDVRERLCEWVRGEASLRWALTPAQGVEPLRRVQDLVDLLARPMAVAALGPWLLPTAIAVVLLIRRQELRDRPVHLRPTPAHVRRLSELEDLCAHNGFTVAGLVKPGLVRQLAVRAVLPLIGFGTRHLFTRESLAGVKSIHFARWIPVDGGRRVVFASNYDGSLENYNNDFIDLVSWGLNLVFSHGVDYPTTRWILFGGARIEQPFKDILRRRQLPTPVWYSAYPTLSALNVDRNAKVRAGLSGPMTEEEAQAWLRLL